MPKLKLRRNGFTIKESGGTEPRWYWSLCRNGNVVADGSYKSRPSAVRGVASLQRFLSGLKTVPVRVILRDKKR